MYKCEDGPCKHTCVEELDYSDLPWIIRKRSELRSQVLLVMYQTWVCHLERCRYYTNRFILLQLWCSSSGDPGQGSGLTSALKSRWQRGYSGTRRASLALQAVDYPCDTDSSPSDCRCSIRFASAQRKTIRKRSYAFRAPAGPKAETATFQTVHLTTI